MATNALNTQAAFKEAYASLNAAQKKAVDTIEGPVMVIAGPGTGKTQILTLRIANILLQTDTAPESILALTFTESGATAMRERLHRYIGAEAYRVSIHTFHGFCGRLISQYPDAYTHILGGRAVNDLERFNIVTSILDSKDIKKLRPLGNPSFYVSAILSTIGELKKEYIPPDALAGIIRAQETDLLAVEQFHQKGAYKGKVRGEYTKLSDTIVKNKELLSVYRQYESILRTQKLYDYEDMILETIKALQTDENMLRDLQEQYQYVLADEHQDVNGSQNKILELLSNFHERPNIFVVGDEKQAIYRFQGASLENFLFFSDAYKDTQTIALTQNYRSVQTILDAAHSLVAVAEGPLKQLRVPLTAEKKDTGELAMRSFLHQAVEDQWIVDHVQRLLKGGVAPQEIAIILRTNKEVEILTGLLRKNGITAEPSSESDVLEHPITNSVLSLMSAAAFPEDASALVATLHAPFWGITANDLFRIFSARNYTHPLRSILSDKVLLQEQQVENVENILNIDTVLKKAVSLEGVDAPHHIVEFLVKESGLLEHVLLIDPVDGGKIIRRLYDEVEQMVIQRKASTLADVCRLFSLYREHNLALSTPYIASHADAVRVLTAHKSKGLEFEAVFVPHLHDSGWGGRTKRELFKIPLNKQIQTADFDALDDERRLLYVSLTRAKSKLFLSFSAQAADGKEQLRSRLCDDIDESTVTEISVEEFEKAFNPTDVIIGGEVKVPIDTHLLKTHLERAGLSPTALNNYLRSPYDYLYRNVLRIPEVQAAPLLFGTAIHSVMEWVSGFVSHKREMPSATAIKNALSDELGRLPITDSQFAQMHEKGFEALLAYSAHVQSAIPPAIHVEQTFSVLLPTGIADFPEIKLTGKLDRLDLDAEGNVVRVVDYKTGSPKTRNVIEGTTKNSDGDYKRQLVFYALLLSLYEDKRYNCRVGMLSFIEPDKKGVIHEESFEITDEEIAELKADIIRVAGEIVSGSFLRTPCDPQRSSYCHLATALLGGR